MTNRLSASLRDAPATVPALLAVVLFVVWATDEAGYPLTHWAPGALIMLALLALGVRTHALRPREAPMTVKVALGCLAAYTALSFLSILWAGVPADAWEGANRTLLYLLVFALFASQRQRGPTAALLLCAWTFALGGLAAFVALHVNAASGANLQQLIPFGRLVYPSGYVNANAALWLMAFWPALLLARARELPWGVRGALAGCAVLLADVALLSQSRGSLYATAVMLVLVFALLPWRTRTFALLLPVAGGIAAAAPAVLRVGDRLSEGNVTTGHVHTATVAIFASAAAVGALVSLGAAIESRRTFSPQAARGLQRGLAAAAVVTLIALLAAGWAAAGDPAARVRHAWNTFTSVRGYAANSSGGRLLSGLGSNRYDFYRVALDEFIAHPLAGIGADNFQQQYLAHGRSTETPRYPHSVELRTLAQTGVIGCALALVGLAAALLACARACLRSKQGARIDALAPAVAAAALGGFAYWLVHGSFDWLWEFAGLGAPAFALLGLGCALAPDWQTGDRRPAVSAGVAASHPGGPPGAGPRPPSAGVAPSGLGAGASSASAAASGANACPSGAGPHAKKPPMRVSRAAVALIALAVVLAAAASLAAPWLSQLEVQNAAHIWPRAPRKAYATLHEAASLNPLSDQAYLLAGSIALRFGDLRRADREFARALARVPDDAYATLERGAIASSTGRRQAAVALLGRARRLNPRDPLTRQALALALAGRRVDISELNDAILKSARRLG